MNESVFRAYSIRGIAGDTITVQDMRRIGQAAATILGETGIVSAVLGRDCRTSSPELAAALREGLLSAGMDVIDIGVCPTPLLSFATDHMGAGAGFMVTASHNPPDHNGIKIRTDHTLQGNELARICQVAKAEAFRHAKGTLTYAAPLDAYLEAIHQRATIVHPLRLVVDAGNGTAGLVAPRLLREAGCPVVPLYCELDGLFPNRTPDPTVPGALDALAVRVIAERADAGFAYDGDGDRLAVIDETGRLTLADQLLALLARAALAVHPGGNVVYEISCSQAVPETVLAAGGRPIPCPVGYAFVHQAMRRTNAILGGETAGHLFFAEPGFQFDDAMLGTMRIAALLSRAGRTLSALQAELPHYVQSPHRRFHCPDNRKAAVVQRIRDHLAAHHLPIEEMDGVKAYLANGWSLFRASNTEPAVTLRCEARTPADLAEMEGTAIGVLRQVLHGIGLDLESAH